MMTRILFLLSLVCSATGLVGRSPLRTRSMRPSSISLRAEQGAEKSAEVAGATPTALEEKMKSWEANDEEIKAASLGGLTPGSMDGFDLGLAVAFPFIVGSCALFILFPLYAPNLALESGVVPM